MDWGLLIFILFTGVAVVVAWLYDGKKRYRTRISLKYFIDNAHKLSDDDMKVMALTNFIDTPSAPNYFINVKLAENSMMQLGYLYDYLDANANISNMYIYDLPAHISDRLASKPSEN